MGKKSNLAIVTDNTGAPPSPPPSPTLSPARQDLTDRRGELAAVRASFEATTERFRRIEVLIPDLKPLESRIAELEGEHAGLIEKWALAGGTGPAPPPPHGGAISKLRAEISQGETIAAGARAALAKMNAEITACQQASADAISAVKHAACAVLMEMAAELVTELEATERRSALLRGYLIALRTHYEFEGHRGNPGGVLASQLGRMMPNGPYEFSTEAIKAAVEEWRALADRLFRDETAEITELRK